MAMNNHVTQVLVIDDTLRYIWDRPLLFTIAVIIIFRVIFRWIDALNWDVHVPRVYVSESTLFQRWTDKFRSVSRGQEAVTKGYRMFPKSFFRINLLGYHSGMIVIDRDHAKELFDAPEDHISFSESFNEGFGLHYLFHGDPRDDYHIRIIRNQLTRKMSSFTSALVDELNEAFAAEFEQDMTAEYKPILVHKKAARVVQRLVHRLFVGLPLCHNSEYLDTLDNHAAMAGLASVALRFVPKYLKSLAVKILFPALGKGEQVAYKYIAPLIEERRKRIESDESEPKPDDLIQWLMESASGHEAKTDYLTSRILMLNLGSVRGTTINFLHMLYNLVAYPEYVEPLREEIISLLSTDGWNKSTISKMRKLDSFVKETFRLHPTGATGTQRLVLKPYTFSNGLTVYPGTTLTTIVEPIHKSEQLYQNPDVFDGFRFSRMEANIGCNSTSTSVDFLMFSHGKHACPGRFFAVYLIKLMLIFVLLRYDLKSTDGKRPKDWYLGLALNPALSAEILFRKREAENIDMLR